MDAEGIMNVMVADEKVPYYIGYDSKLEIDTLFHG
jgi:hypothetical protein